MATTERKEYLVWVIVSRRGVPQGDRAFNTKREALAAMMDARRYPASCRVEQALLTVPFRGPA